MQYTIVIEAELELGIGDDDAARRSVVGSSLIEPDADVADLRSQFLADELLGLCKADVLVMLALLRLGGRRENWLGQLVRLAQAFRQSDAADRAGRLIILPARADDVAAHYRFHHDRFQSLGDDRAAA